MTTNRPAGQHASQGHRLRGGALLSAVLSLAALLVLPTIAQATPTVTLKAKVVPVPVNPNNPKSRNYPHTGNIRGAGAAVETLFTISGSEYAGAPMPLVGVNVYLPAGTKLRPQAFATCPNATLESHEVQRCPRRSIASPMGEVLGVVSFGGSRVQEKASVQAFFAPGGGLAFFTEGRSPVSLEVLSRGKFTTAPHPFGPKLVTEVPLVSTVPGAPYASVERIKIKVGAAIKRKGKLISYGTVPKKCPKGGFPGKAELKFLGGETVTVSTKVPCPKK